MCGWSRKKGEEDGEDKPSKEQYFEDNVVEFMSKPRIRVKAGSAPL